MIPARTRQLRWRLAWVGVLVVARAASAPAGTTSSSAPPSTTITTSTTSTTSTLGGPFCSFFDVFVDVVPLPPARISKPTIEGTPCPVTPGTGACTDETMNLAMSHSSGCWNVAGRGWPALALNEARLGLQAGANVKCVDVCLVHSCPSRGGRPYCVQRGATLMNLACHPAVDPPACAAAGEGRYDCTATLTLCKCRCSKSAFF